MNKLVIIAFVFLGLLNSIVAQTQLQYHLNQQGNGDCPGSTVTLSVSTSVNITTAAVSEISSNAATTGGNITNDGGNPITQRGVCWSTSPNPTTSDNITNNGNGLGSFTSSLSELAANTTYYIRAYAINSAGIFYGNEVSFTTGNESNPTAHSCGAENVHNPNLNYGTMTDQEGNVYKTIVIGNQEWMAENLKTSTYRNGDLIPNVTDNEQWDGQLTGAWCNYNNDPQLECPYGKLYNWYTVFDSRNVCPIGWHVPNYLEWSVLFNSFGGQPLAGNKLKSIGSQFWYSSQNVTNESGFSGVPSGSRNVGGGFSNIGAVGIWWGTSLVASDFAWNLYLDASSSYAGTSDGRFRQGFAIRCLKNNDSTDIGIQEGIIDNIDCFAATYNETLVEGAVVNDVIISVPYSGGNGDTYPAQTITSTGVSGLTATLTAGNFVIGGASLTYTIAGTPFTSGIASFALSIGGQSCTLQIPVNAPQIGNPHSCGAENIHSLNFNYGNLTDQDGNLYKTIVIGTQEWMAENLKTSIYRNGDPIPNVSDAVQWTGLSTGAWCFYNNESQNDCPYGKLYNWYTVADPRNVCPAGWHVPTDGEWNTLIGFLDPAYNPNAPINFQSFLAGGKLKSAGLGYWLTPNLDATNESGFSALPGGGSLGNGAFSNIGQGGIWWSSSENIDVTVAAWYRYLYSNNANVQRASAGKRCGSSVRCIRD
jgi:uncharacterized protein (TIGR02145 family)